MNKLLYIFYIACLLSCQGSQTQNKEKAAVKTQDIRNEGSTTVSSKKEAKEEINPALKESLNGIWASHEYREELYKSNSVTTAVKAISYYTDIVFDGVEILHCSKPTLMEQDYLFLKPDSTVTNNDGIFIFKIIKIENQLMQINTSNNKVYTYERVIKHADLDQIFMEVIKGSTAIEKEWIAGSYKVVLDTLEFNASILKTGEVTSELDLKSVDLYSYLDKDIIAYRFNNDSFLPYIIKKYSDALITLEGIETITDMDEPPLPNGKVGYMKKQ